MSIKSVEEIRSIDEVLAIIIRNSFNNDGCNFLTPNNFPLQVGIHLRKSDEYIPAHRHFPFEELKNLPVQEFFYIEKGKIRVGVYNGNRKHVDVILSQGDMMLVNCPHDMTFLEDSKIIELKQGPYRGRSLEKEDLNL